MRKSRIERGYFCDHESHDLSTALLGLEFKQDPKWSASFDSNWLEPSPAALRCTWLQNLSVSFQRATLTLSKCHQLFALVKGTCKCWICRPIATCCSSNANILRVWCRISLLAKTDHWILSCPRSFFSRYARALWSFLFLDTNSLAKMTLSGWRRKRKYSHISILLQALLFLSFFLSLRDFLREPND